MTPNSDFYRIDTALLVPQVSPDHWRLRVHGLVDHELELTFDDLLKRPLIERDVTLSCVSNEVGGDLVGNAVWRGARLADLLREAGVQPEATQLFSTSVDGWTCGTPVATVMDGRDAILAVAMNGEPLPLRARVPGPPRRPRPVRLRERHQVGRGSEAHDLGRRRRVLGAARVVAGGADQDDEPHRRAAATAPI